MFRYHFGVSSPVLPGVVPPLNLTAAYRSLWYARFGQGSSISVSYTHLTNEKKIDNAIGIVANENKYHPIRDYLSALVWDGTERIRFCLRHFLGADADDYT